MFLSQLRIDTDNIPGKLWLRNLYRVHQRLCMAFPSKHRLNADKDFLAPFNPADFADGQVHVKRQIGKGFLFRVDPQGGNVVILVLSATNPNWEYAFHNAGYFLAAAPEVKEYNLSFTKGQPLKFRLAANTTRRCSKNSIYSALLLECGKIPAAL